MRTEEKTVARVTANQRFISPGAEDPQTPARDSGVRNTRTVRMLRLGQVRAMTGLGKTKIYELQAEGNFPMRIKITEYSVAWIEDEVQAWLAARIENSPPLATF